MAHTRDTKAQTTSSLNPTTLSYTCGAGVTLLVLIIGANDTTGRGGGTPTYNGVNMVDSGQGVISQGGGETCIEVWYLTNPAKEAAHDISVPNSNLASLWLCASSYIAGSGKESALDDSDSNTGNDAAPTVTSTPTVDGDVIVAGTTTGDRDVPTAAENEIYTNDWGNQVGSGEDFLQSSAASKAMNWTGARSETWEAIAVAFKEIDAVSDLEINVADCTAAITKLS